jgi:hypothetical protein
MRKGEQEMNGKWFVGMAVIVCLIVAGCATIPPTIVRSPRFNTSASVIYTVLPFADANETKYKMRYPNATSIVRDAVETAFFEKGINLVGCGRDDLITSSIEFRAAGVKAMKETDKRMGDSMALAGAGMKLTDQRIGYEEAIKIGENAGADIVILGTVTAFYRGVYIESYTTVGFSVKAIDVKTGELVGKASVLRSTKWRFDYDPAIYANEIAKEVIGQLVDENRDNLHF